MTIAVIILVVLCCVGIPAGCLVFGGATAGPGFYSAYRHTNEFFDALKWNDYDTAFNLLHPEFQKVVESKQKLSDLIQNTKTIPSSWSFQGVFYRVEVGSLGPIVTIGGAVTYVDQEKSDFELQYLQSEGDWKIIYITLNR